MFFDNLAIPADAKNVAEAYELINYLYRPEVAAKNSDFLSYANGNLASQKLVDPKILDDRNIYPDDATLKKLFVITARDPATQRIINRLWTRVKTGSSSHCRVAHLVPATASGDAATAIGPDIRGSSPRPPR